MLNSEASTVQPSKITSNEIDPPLTNGNARAPEPSTDPARSASQMTDHPGFERVRGKVIARFRTDGGRTQLKTLFQQGSAKCMLPQVYGRPTEAVLLNTAGGLTGGDVLDVEVDTGDGHVVATSQTAERIYRAQSGRAQVSNHLRVGERGTLAWLPQETILFDGGHLLRRLEIELAATSELWALESVVLGRTAMGERFTNGFVSDQWRIRRAGKLIYADGLRLGSSLRDANDRTHPSSPAESAARPSVLNGAVAFGTLIHVAANAEDMLPRARAAITQYLTSNSTAGGDIHVAASAWNGLLSVRFVAHSGRRLRSAIIDVVTALRGLPMPRVWSL